jgi:hypothetical protein
MKITTLFHNLFGFVTQHPRFKVFSAKQLLYCILMAEQENFCHVFSVYLSLSSDRQGQAFVVSLISSFRTMG